MSGISGGGGGGGGGSSFRLFANPGKLGYLVLE